jgi:hypothetical protein
MPYFLQALASKKGARELSLKHFSISFSASSTLTKPAAFIIAHGLYFLIISSM